MSLFRTSDNGNNWAFIKQYTSNASDHVNAKSDGIIMACCESLSASVGQIFIDKL